MTAQNAVNVKSINAKKITNLSIDTPDIHQISTGLLKMREWKMRYGQKCKGGKCGSRSQGWKMQE